MAPLVVLIGAPGAGKTTVGRVLAEQLGVGFRDSDADVEARADATITEIFVDEGEEGFRRREREAVRDALQTHTGVLALGGGAVEDTETRADLEGRTVVLLSVGASEAAKRAGISGPRPLLLGNVRTRWLGQLRRREPIYEQCARFTVATDHRTVVDIVDESNRELATVEWL